MIDIEQLKARLRSTGCADEQIPSILDEIENFRPEATDMLSEWINTNLVKEFSIHGITPLWLRENKNLADIGIIISFDWLLKDGESAATALRKPLR
ncbi:MAG: hypothetical protein LBN00_11550 [Oscillospiraceae bacterium]|jgi:hypothetical protein|nr:hypothetical protein [Oscillospiraceae bacterium]